MFSVILYFIIFLQKSLSVWALKSPGSSQKSATPYKDPLSFSTPPRRRQSVYWYETVTTGNIDGLDKKRIERQEVRFFICHIYKLAQPIVPI